MDQFSEPVWRELLARHRERLAPFALDRVERSARREKHPVRDFLFEYYSYRPAHLLRWTPGPNVILENAAPGDLPWIEVTPVAGGLVLRADSFPDHRRSFAKWALEYLEGIAQRPPLFGCFGLHEWAMVYHTPEVRHQRTPLRLAPDAIAAVVEREQLCCTHYDAFRFFTPAAVPRNRLQLNRETTDRFDQRGCIHVTMDLYRYAYKIAPWVPGELIADAFELAAEARQLDMRASPYDLRSLGLKPIAIETLEGKEEYVRGQKELSDRAAPIRERLIESYRLLTANAPPNHK
ncbi:MAG TPA: 3-methyladenine DNA glycosylase [Gemmataceae bacterium]|nr:3-methyladenine DNA glycosylase [Gemmataceae bacterium]